MTEKMKTVENGDTVKVHYTGSFTEGGVFDSSKDRDPLEFEVGKGEVIPGFEKMVLGMTAGDSKTETITADLAYGHRNDDLMAEVELTRFPEDIELEVGRELQLKQEDGRVVRVLVTDLNNTSAKLDANHPLAGRDLIFTVDLIEIK